MSPRSIVGIAFYVIGLILLAYAGLNFDSLFFAQRLVTKTDIPTYARMVFMPILAAVLILLDGSFIANLKGRWSGGLYALGNFAWLYGFELLYGKLSVPVSEIDSYRNLFYLISAGLLLFIIGAILNDVSRRPRDEQQATRQG